jgi:hypothetical protein
MAAHHERPAYNPFLCSIKDTADPLERDQIRCQSMPPPGTSKKPSACDGTVKERIAFLGVTAKLSGVGYRNLEGEISGKLRFFAGFMGCVIAHALRLCAGPLWDATHFRT